MMIRYNVDILRFPSDLEKGRHEPLGVRLALVGTDGLASPFETELARFRGTRDWHHVAFRIRTGKEVPLGANAVALQVTVYGGSGIVWIDNVQFEAKDHPTPFIESTRPPHDLHLTESAITSSSSTASGN
jgi:hypothetical protein